MNHLGSLCLSLIFLASAPARSAVPVEEEPRHRLTFSNQYVRVFHVLIPPGDTSLFHTHMNDGLSVRLADARIRDEALGGTPEDSSVKRGAVTFGYRPSPLTHRVSSIGSTPFSNIFVEILPSAGSVKGASPRALVAGRTLVLENERVRLTRLLLAAGQSIASIHALPGLRVAVSEGRIAVEVPGEKAKTVKFEPGDTKWHEGGTQHTLQNVGSAPFEAVEIELKLEVALSGLQVDTAKGGTVAPLVRSHSLNVGRLEHGIGHADGTSTRTSRKRQSPAGLLNEGASGGRS